MRAVAKAWDEAAALGFRWGSVLPATWTRGALGLLERGRRLACRSRRFEGADTSLTYVGRDRFAAEDLAARLGLSERGSPRRPPRVRPGARFAPADLTVVEITRSEAERWAGAGYLVLPHLVATTVDLREDEHALWDRERRRRASRIRESVIARIDPGGRASFDAFYERLYVPTVRARFGARGYVARRHHLRRLAQHGLLLHAREGDREVATGLLSFTHGRSYPIDLRVWGAPAEDASPSRPYQPLEALVVLAIDEARRRRAERLGLGLGYPFLGDGSLRFKKRWGGAMHVEPHDPRRFAVSASTEAAVEALTRHGAIHETRGGLRALRPPGEEAPSATRGIGGWDALRRPDELAELARSDWLRTPRRGSGRTGRPGVG